MFFENHIILIPVIAWFVSVLLKGIYHHFFGTLTLARALGSGGMPSVHSSMVTSLTTAIAVKYGIYSDIFAVAAVFSLIIIYDAMNVRFEAGLHAKALNQIMQNKYSLNEMIGHLPEEALAGSVIGVIVGYCLMHI